MTSNGSKLSIAIAAKSHNCAHCKRSYESVRTLQHHLNKYHSKKNEKATNNFQYRTSLLKCELCERIYKTSASLRYHVLNHGTQYNYKCSISNCAQTFKNPKLLTEHRRMQHKDIRTAVSKTSPQQLLLCEYCGYRTHIKCNLLVHKRRHTGEKPYCCERCGKCFAALYQLSAHSVVHGDIKQRRRCSQYKCTDCGIIFLCRTALSHHKPLHLAEKKYICAICQKAYAQSAGYSQHMRWHRERGNVFETLAVCRQP